MKNWFLLLLLPLPFLLHLSLFTQFRFLSASSSHLLFRCTYLRLSKILPFPISFLVYSLVPLSLSFYLSLFSVSLSLSLDFSLYEPSLSSLYHDETVFNPVVNHPSAPHTTHMLLDGVWELWDTGKEKDVEK